jgi:DNA-binding CsgD family transcriptional regulator
LAGSEVLFLAFSMFDQITINDLPNQLRELSLYIGLEKTLLMSREYGGQVFGGSRKKEFDQVAQLLGRENADRFFDWVGTTPLELNTLRVPTIRARDRAVAGLLADGFSTIRISRRLGISRNQARQAVSRVKRLDANAGEML